MTALAAKRVFFNCGSELLVFIVGEMALHMSSARNVHRGWGGYDLRAGGGD
jgi:hypothetical protein